MSPGGSFHDVPPVCTSSLLFAGFRVGRKAGQSRHHLIPSPEYSTARETHDHFVFCLSTFQLSCDAHAIDLDELARVSCSLYQRTVAPARSGIDFVPVRGVPRVPSVSYAVSMTSRLRFIPQPHN